MKESKCAPTKTGSLAPLIKGDSSIEVMEEVLDEVLSKVGKELILSLLREKYGLKKDIARRPEALHKTLGNVLGDGGRVIESMIVHKITYKKVES